MRVSAAKKARLDIAILIPMSATRRARPLNSTVSSSGRPKSLTSRAPETLKRSVIVELIAAFSCMDSRDISARRRPT